MAFKCCFGFYETPIFDRDQASTKFEDHKFEEHTFEEIKPNIIPKSKNPRQVLSSEYIRFIIDSNYEPTLNWFDFASINGITAFLQREYSPLITVDMVYEALLLEPHYKISYRMDAPGCRFIRHKISM
jgi:hypothetical protein